MKRQEARQLGMKIHDFIEAGLVREAYALLEPVLSQRTPFPLLDLIGETLARDTPSGLDAFLDHVASHKTEGGWVVIASALGTRIDYALEDAFERSQKFILLADVWYATDIFGERVPGRALVVHFDEAWLLLSQWRDHPNPWIRRTVGVAVHFWAKRSQGSPEHLPKAHKLLELLEPLFEERNTVALKGIGWGIKTMGKYYPDLLANWLRVQLLHRHRRPRILMLRKALTYLPPSHRQPIEEILARWH